MSGEGGAPSRCGMTKRIVVFLLLFISRARRFPAGDLKYWPILNLTFSCEQMPDMQPCAYNIKGMPYWGEMYLFSTSMATHRKIIRIF